MDAVGLWGAMQYAEDVEGSAAWYADFLGVEQTPYGMPMFVWGEGARLWIAPASAGTGRGGTSVWFEVADVVRTYEERKARGYVFNEEPMAYPEGKIVTVNDPDGNIVGLVDRRQGTS